MWHKQRFIDTMTYLLDELPRLEVSSLQSLVLIIIHHMNLHHDVITLDSLAKHLHASISEVDDAMEYLQQKGYLKIEHHQGKVCFNVDGIFNQTHHQPTHVSVSLHDAFEQSFKRLLNEKEYNQLTLWSKMYSEALILHALRQALIQEKISIAYIGKILDNWKKANLKEEDLLSE